jgi:hypothetical protein
MLTLLQLLEEACDSNNAPVVRLLLCSKNFVASEILNLAYRKSTSAMIINELFNFLAITEPSALLPSNMAEMDLLLSYLRGHTQPPTDLD